VQTWTLLVALIYNIAGFLEGTCFEKGRTP
jgi:hypothetical protein